MSFSKFLVSLVFVLSGANGCIFRSFFGTDSEKEFNSTSNSNKDNAFQLDKDIMSVVQQTLVKTLISMDKLKFKCPQENGGFPDLMDCSKFYTCTNFNVTVEHCEPGTGYEPLAKSCVPAESVPLCQKTQKLEDHKCNDTGLFTFEGDCSKFILCTKEAAYATSCNRGDLFDPNFKLCLPESEVNCTSISTTNKDKFKLDTSSISEYENEIPKS